MGGSCHAWPTHSGFFVKLASLRAVNASDSTLFGTERTRWITIRDRMGSVRLCHGDVACVPGTPRRLLKRSVRAKRAKRPLGDLVPLNHSIGLRENVFTVRKVDLGGG